jgi:large subunit ribosomal protein L4
MEKKIYSIYGNELRTIKLDDAIFGIPTNAYIVYYAINNELANKRVGTVCTKDRSAVRGSNVKPYKQKKTGRARCGDKKSPLLRGGGVIFGPKPRNYNYTLPKKMKRLALKSILSMKTRSNCLTVVEDFTIENGKTRELLIILNRFMKDERTVIVLSDSDTMIKRAGNNIPCLSFLSYNRLRAHDLYYSRRVIILESAVEKLNKLYHAVGEE